MMRSRLLTRLALSEKGISITEFGLISPVLIVMLMGVMDMGHTLYMQSVIQGSLQKAARDASLESGTQDSVYQATKTDFTNQVQRLAANATVNLNRTAFRDYTKAANPVKEPFTDTNANGRCDNGEPYEDNNNSGAWDTDNGRSGTQGGAKDIVVYAAQVQYPRLFPMAGLIGLPSDVNLNASVSLVNQPYGDQAAVTVRNCP
jgi:Flp pilus assembly protein TadG